MKMFQFRKAFLLVLFVSVLYAAAASDVIYDNDPIRITVYEYSGNTVIYNKNEKTGKYVPLYSDVNEASFSGLFLKAGSSFRRLSRVSGSKVNATLTDNGVKVVYQIPGQADVAVNYTVFASEGSKIPDAVRIDISVTNTKSVTETYAVKALFDTYLGESSGVHFSTAEKDSLNTETEFLSMDDDMYIKSSNGKESMRLLLNGGNTSAPASVMVANRDKLAKSVWAPAIDIGSLFDSAKTVNNSAVLVTWREVLLKSMASCSYTFYMTAALDGNEPADIVAVCGEGSVDLYSTAEGEPVYTDSYGNVFTVGEVTEQQLDPEYIQDLFSRINKLKGSSKASDIDEIKKLNAELDAILLKLESN